MEVMVFPIERVEVLVYGVAGLPLLHCWLPKSEFSSATPLLSFPTPQFSSQRASQRESGICVDVSPLVLWHLRMCSQQANHCTKPFSVGKNFHESFHPLASHVLHM